MKLYHYYRSSCSYRVRIAMNLKKIQCELIPIHLLKNEQEQEQFKNLNPQGLVPALVLDNGQVISQSLAIIDYFENLIPSPSLFPKEPVLRAQALAFSYALTMDVQPLNNLRVLKYLQNEFHADEEQKKKWYVHWVNETFTALEKSWHGNDKAHYCFGSQISLADVSLVPQVYNALRYDMDIQKYPLIKQRYEICLKHPAFIAAKPENFSF